MSDEVVLDTTVASLLLRPDERLELYREEMDRRRLVLPFQAVAELRRGIRMAGWGSARAAVLDRLLQKAIVHNVSQQLIEAWVEISCHAERRGRRLETGDAWIAATAIRLQLPLLTHDADFRDLQYPGLTVICRAP